jgi:hypothetical protein
MKLPGMVMFAFALLALPAGTSASESLSTERHVHGVITAVEPAVVTIASTQRTVTGKIDPVRTKVTINGKPGTLADLKVTAHAKAELCLDEVWVSIAAH